MRCWITGVAIYPRRGEDTDAIKCILYFFNLYNFNSVFFMQLLRRVASYYLDSLSEKDLEPGISECKEPNPNCIR